MRKFFSFVVCTAALASVAQANLLVNGSLDNVVTPPNQPADWTVIGNGTIVGPFVDVLTNEPWAGPAPTPVTANDQGVFFKAFQGGTANGPMTGHLYQDGVATPGTTYTLTGWAGAEAAYTAGRTELAIDFLDINGTVIPAAGSALDLLAAGLKTDNGLAFDYKQYSVTSTAPASAAFIRSRVSMIDGIPNPAGGGQAFVVDDFSLVVPEPTSLAALTLGSLFLKRRRA